MKFKFLLSIAFITTLVACGGAEERKAVYMEKAKLSIETGDLDKARIELKNVLQIDPKDSEALHQLGKIFEGKQEFPKAYRHYLKVEELNPEHLQNQARLGRFYLLLNEPDKTQEKIDLILSKEPDNADGLMLKAALMLRNEKVDEALILAKDNLAKHPEHVESIQFLAALYIREKKFTEAVKVLDTALKGNENNESLNRLLAAALTDNKEYKRAEVIYKSFLERNPDNKASYDNLAAFYNQIGNEAKAEETLRASFENDVGDVDRQLSFIKYIREIKGNRAAIDELKDLIVSNKSIGKLRTALSELYIIEKDIDSAIEVSNQAINDFSEEETGVLSRITLASIYLSEKNFDKADEIVETAMTISPNDPAVNFMRAKLALLNKDTEKAIISLRIVIKEKPENIDAYILLAEVYQYTKNIEQANNALNTAYDNNKTNAEGLLKLAQYQLSRDVGQASRIVDSYNSLKEADYDGLSMKALLLNNDKKYLEAYKIAETLMETYPDKPNGYIYAVSYHGQQGDSQKAISVLEKGYSSTKDNRKLLLLWTALQLRDKKYDVIEERIKSEMSAAPDDVELKVLLGKVYILENNTSLAVPLLNEAISIDADLETPYMLLSQAYEIDNDPKASKSILIKGAANAPASFKIPLKLASIYEEDGEFNEAINIYDNLNQSNPENLVVINNLASLLSEYGDGEASLEWAASLIKKLEGSNRPEFLDTVGWVYYKLGNAEKAIEKLKQVVEKMPNVNVFNYHLGMAYKLSGDKAQARVYLEKSLSNKRAFIDKSSAEEALKSL